MNIGQVIAQLRAYASPFGGRVAGGAAYAKSVQDQVWMALPAAYVIPLDDTPGENELMNATLQLITERIGVIVVFDNTADRRGQGPVNNMDAIRSSLFRSLVNWRPDSTVDNPGTAQASNPFADHESRGLYYEGGRVLDFDLARLFYEYDFAVDLTIDESDTWVPTGVPLDEIMLEIDTNGDGVPDVLAAAVTAALAQDPATGSPDTAPTVETEQGFGVLIDNPPVPQQP